MENKTDHAECLKLQYIFFFPKYVKLIYMVVLLRVYAYKMRVVKSFAVVCCSCNYASYLTEDFEGT